MRARTLVSLACLVATAVVAGPHSMAAPTRGTATPRYTYGCVGAPPCEKDWQLARRGVLHGSSAPWPCVFYGPPFVWPCWTSETTTAGIDVFVWGWSKLIATATVQGMLPPGLPGVPVIPTRACLSAGTDDHGGALDFGCKDVPRKGRAVLRTAFGGAPFQTGNWIVYVSLDGAPGKVFVSRISYRIVPTGPPPGALNTYGHGLRRH